MTALARVSVAFALGCAGLIGSAASGQVTPTAPTREEVERPVPDRPEQERPRLTVEGEMDRAPCALDRPDYRDISFTLADVVFEDLRGLPADALRPAFAHLVGREQPVAAICEVRDRAAAILREAGYVAAIEVPEQRIADGTVRLRVVMARLVGLRVRGDAGRAERLIAGYLEPLTNREVFNRYEAERSLLLAGDLPGYTVRLALRSAGRARGEVIGEVTVRYLPVVVDFSVQNFGSRDLGRWGGLLRAQFFGLTGLGDRTSLAFFTTADFAEQQTLQAAHDFRIGGDGLAIGAQVTYAWANPDFGDPLVDITSETLFATVEASYPLIRRQAETLRGWIGLDIVDQDVALNAIPINRDRLRVAFLRLSYDASDAGSGDPRWSLAVPRWRAGGWIELRQGLGILGASEDCGPALAACLVPGVVPPTRQEGDPTATIVRGGAQVEYRPVPKATLALGARAQLSGDPLFSFEEFAAGNYTVGRGYDPGAIVGDSGFGVQAELRFGRSVPRSPQELAFEPFVFFDQAWVWNEEALFPIPRQELSSIGGGVRAAYGDRFRVEAVLAVPLDRAGLQTERGDVRFLISFTTLLWPWTLQ